ncbi:hypothetical protein BSL78_24354 [Apostichopus japonicus]|uniref:Uncharacterized protein n=1 Tax=Stichopus japonicus TaxID=307972 RepID=A0A2G8JSV4_STIJA|nr:hypothetical protein BSL78_24354 [Apostichopus japonicus]
MDSDEDPIAILHAKSRRRLSSDFQHTDRHTCGEMAVRQADGYTGASIERNNGGYNTEGATFSRTCGPASSLVNLCMQQIPFQGQLIIQHPMEQNVKEYLTYVITETIPLSSNRLNQIKTESLSDETKSLAIMCINGWPLSKNECAMLVRPYWTIQNELSVIDGVVFKGKRIVVPQSLMKGIKALRSANPVYVRPYTGRV